MAVSSWLGSAKEGPSSRFFDRVNNKDVNAFVPAKTASCFFGDKEVRYLYLRLQAFPLEWHRFFWEQGFFGAIVTPIFVASMVLVGFQRRWHRFFGDKVIQCFEGRSQVEAFWHRFFWEQGFFGLGVIVTLIFVAAMVLKGFQRKTAPLLWGQSSSVL
jgi:hypothetical protein